MGKLFWRSWYSFLAWYSERQGATFSCMNWGYDDGRALVDGPFAAERYPLQLYHALTESTPLAGRVVVDASCGRGGGLHYLASAFRPAMAHGVDYTPGNVAIAQKAFGDQGLPLSYRQGDAETLQGFDDASVDAVLSVEASHCYPDIDAFFAAARRVLKPGGHLLWTDFMPTERLSELRRQFGAHFDVVEERDITPHVLAAMRADAPRRQALIERHSAGFLKPVMRNFAAADESCDTVQRFITGSHTYFIYKLVAR
ncbi:MAG: class I SAM-dependent methyltransferase [Candidatus Sericytochromatia bacterium]